MDTAMGEVSAALVLNQAYGLEMRSGSDLRPSIHKVLQTGTGVGAMQKLP